MAENSYFEVKPRQWATNNRTSLRHLFPAQLEIVSFLGGIEKQALKTLSLVSKIFYLLHTDDATTRRFQTVNRPGMRQDFAACEGYISTRGQKCQPTHPGPHFTHGLPFLVSRAWPVAPFPPPPGRSWLGRGYSVRSAHASPWPRVGTGLDAELVPWAQSGTCKDSSHPHIGFSDLRFFQVPDSHPWNTCEQVLCSRFFRKGESGSPHAFQRTSLTKG